MTTKTEEDLAQLAEDLWVAASQVEDGVELEDVDDDGNAGPGCSSQDPSQLWGRSKCSGQFPMS